MAPYEALYWRYCTSPVCWFEPGEAWLLGTDLVQDVLDKVKVIQERLRTAQSRQKSYADRKVYDVSSMVREKVLLMVSPMKGVMIFMKKGKLSHRFIGPFEEPQRTEEVAYELAFPPSLLSVHPVQLDGDLAYDVEPVAILEPQVRKLRSKDIASVKVQWTCRPIEEATWETNREM
ncbi:uncharacterized protein [Nicotiana sylvestris]|uniref:uncharacterized protein n=1 Tax=Nicotiana sylvestris TaxID=4096 RepID=UPI00388C6971